MDDLKSKLPEDYIDRTPEQFRLLDDIVPTEVCHYTSLQTALEKILPTKNLRLGRITSTNDPRESKDRLYKISVQVENGEKTQIEYNQQEYLKEWRVFCTSCHNDPLGEFKSTFNYEKYGVAYSNMWAHYAKHNGVCLLFDGKILDNNMRQIYGDVKHGFVEYDFNKAISIPQTYLYESPELIRQYQLNHYRENFLYKTPQWRYEHEFRWLIQSQIDSEIFVSIENALKAVIVGVDFDYVYLPSLKALCEGSRIPVHKICWTNGRPTFFFDR
jgi:hypothetical protein